MPVDQVPQEQVHHPKAGHLGKEPYGAPESRNCRQKGVICAWATPDTSGPVYPTAIKGYAGSRCQGGDLSTTVQNKAGKGDCEAALYL